MVGDGVGDDEDVSPLVLRREDKILTGFGWDSFSLLLEFLSKI